MQSDKLTMDDLYEQFRGRPIPYEFLVDTTEWEVIRNRIVKRDKEVCTKCRKGATIGHNGSNTFFGFKLKTPSISGDIIIERGDNEKELYDSDKHIHLEVHHRYYIRNKYPWEYPDAVLITLCNWCHQELHNTERVPYYDSEGQSLNYAPCYRCSGRGSFSQYRHVKGGVCFRCKGARFEQLIGNY